MNLQNGYKVIYEKIAGGERTFFADKLDNTAAKQIGDAFKIGEYKLVFEKNGRIFGSVTGKVEDGEPIAAFDEVFKVAEEVEPVMMNNDDEELDQTETSDDEEEPANDELGDETDPEVNE